MSTDDETPKIGSSSGNEAGVVGLMQMLQMLLEDRRRRKQGEAAAVNAEKSKVPLSSGETYRVG